MNRPLILAAYTLLLSPGLVFAKDPCHTRSRQMTLAKNCYSGDMVKGFEGGPQFFGVAAGSTPAVNYCYNSLVDVEHKPNEGTVRIHVLKDGKDGQVHAYEYSFALNQIKDLKKDYSLVTLKGLKGECFSPTGDKEACSGGLLKAIGLKDTNAPLVAAVGKVGASQFTVNHLATDAKELDAHKPKELDGSVIVDSASVTAKLMQSIRYKLSQIARTKTAIMQSGKTTPKKLADSSEQFRYCAMAFESFLKFQKLSDPFTPEEKMTLNTLTNYMNNDPNFNEHLRAPASSTPVVSSKIHHR